MRVGVNVAPGQTVFITARIEHAPLARALTRASYDAGARYVDVFYVDQHVRRAMIEHGPDEALDHTPTWLVERWQAMGGNATIGTAGDPEPELLADLPGERVGRARMAQLAEVQMAQMADRLVNWTGLAYPSAGWAEKVFGEPDVERLWEAVAFCTRLDEVDPAAAWRAHMDRLDRRAAALNERAFDAIHYRGPGTDLTVGLLDQARWISARFQTAAGIEYVPNMPTEEIFTTPDCRRADGVVSRQQAPRARRRHRRRAAADVRAGPDRPGRRRPRRRAGPRPARVRRSRGLPRRAGAGRRIVARRPDRPHVLRHPVRRERHLPHRLRLRPSSRHSTASPATA